MVGDLAGGAADHVIENEGFDLEEAKGDLTSAAITQGLGAAGIENEAVSAAIEGGVTAAIEGEDAEGVLGSAAQGGIESFTGLEEVKIMGETEQTNAAIEDASEMKLNYQKPGKKATTILSPHLDTIDYGSIIIVLDNSDTSHNIDVPITGKIKVNLT